MVSPPNRSMHVALSKHDFAWSVNWIAGHHAICLSNGPFFRFALYSLTGASKFRRPSNGAPATRHDSSVRIASTDQTVI
jgi:hypothetical protein